MGLLLTTWLTNTSIQTTWSNKLDITFCIVINAITVERQKHPTKHPHFQHRLLQAKGKKNVEID